MRRIPWLLGVLLVGATARADMLPDGYKGVRSSIVVTAEVPAGKSLVLANTFAGADLIRAGAPAQVDWHPMGGAMQLQLVDSGKLADLEKRRAELDRDAIAATLKGATKCGEPFQGVRTIPETSPAAEVRWHYAVAVDGGTCTARLTRTEYLGERGEPVDPAFDGPADSPPPPRPYAPEADEVADAPAPIAAPKPPTPPAPGPKEAKGCSVGEPGSGAALLLVALVALRRRRTR